MMIDEGALRELRADVRGRIVQPHDADYDRVRRIFNAMIDRRPAVIARCASTADVAASVRWARARGIDICVRSGGHNVSGKSISDGALMIDLSTMKGAKVDVARGVVHADAGLVLGELDRACQAYGLATPTGNVSPTGIAGLTLGGGIGWLNGLYGLACDNVRSVEMVTADGRVVRVSAVDHPDLFWAVRGGGANIGVVTALEYRLHRVGPVLGGGVLWPVHRAKPILRFYAEFAENCPDELNINAGFSTVDGGTVLGIGAAWIGPLDRGEQVLKPLRTFDHPLGDAITPMSYVDLQCGGDGGFPTGRRHYWKGGFLRRLTPEVVDILVDFAQSRPSAHTGLALQQMHGAAARVPPDATAFAHRHDQWDCLILAQWDRAADDERNIAWARHCYRALEPHLDRGVYVNDLGADEAPRVKAAYGANFERLRAVKVAYDPENVFRGNQNVAAVA